MHVNCGFMYAVEMEGHQCQICAYFCVGSAFTVHATHERNYSVYMHKDVCYTVTIYDDKDELIFQAFFFSFYIILHN